jgi:hypothetical protein
MAVGYGNLDSYVKGLLAGADIGQTHYMVDSDYRTAAQGWSRADRTGPLDLYEARKVNSGGSNIVFRTADYGSDALALQAANDAMVDFRGDVLVLTPGDYSAATAVTIDVPDARWIGRPVGHATQASATLTAGVAAAFAVGAAADRFEVGYLRLVPFTAESMFAIADGANNQYFHNFFYDARGVASSTATQMVLAAGAMDASVFTDFIFMTDDAQGPLIELDGTTVGLLIQNFLHIHTGDTLVISLLDIDGAGSTGITVGPGHGQIGGTDGAVTNLIAAVDLTHAATNFTLRQFTGSVGYSTTAVVIEAATGVAAEGDIVDSWIATIAGGAGRAAYVGTS